MADQKIYLGAAGNRSRLHVLYDRSATQRLAAGSVPGARSICQVLGQANNAPAVPAVAAHQIGDGGVEMGEVVDAAGGNNVQMTPVPLLLQVVL